MIEQSKLNKLPSELITKEIEEEGKVHSLDAPHVVKHTVNEFLRKQSGVKSQEEIEQEAKNKLSILCEYRPVNQETIDSIRLRVLDTLAEANCVAYREGRKLDLAVKHIWFPENDWRVYEMRSGNPPCDSERPMWLRGCSIELDPTCLPKTIINTIRNNKIAKKMYESFMDNRVKEIEREYELKQEQSLIVEPNQQERKLYSYSNQKSGRGTGCQTFQK